MKLFAMPIYSIEKRRSGNRLPGLSQIKETLCNWISKTVKTPCDLEPIVRKGNAADQIDTIAKGEKDDLVVIGALTIL